MPKPLNELRHPISLFIIPISISLIAGILLVNHAFFPFANIDRISYILIAIILLPWVLYWLPYVIKSIEISGVGKVETREIDRIEKEAKRTWNYSIDQIPSAEGKMQYDR